MTSPSRQVWARLPLHAVIVATCILWSLPATGLLISSFRTRDDLLHSGWWTVLQPPLDFAQFTWENYIQVATTAGMGQAFLNSLTIAVPATVIPIAIATFAAYALAWMRFPGRKLLLAAIVVLLVVPLQMTLIPVLRVYAATGLSGTFVGIWLAHTGYGLPLGIYLMRNYIAALPAETIEAAAVDGASHWQIMTRVVLPLSLPAIASLAVFQFLWVWNDLLVALVYLSGAEEFAPLTVQLSNLVGSRGQDWHLLTAGAFVSMAVPMAVFFGLQRFFVRGIVAGSVKG